MSNVFDDLSNEDLRNELIARGVNAGPITHSTRSIYLKKLVNLTTSGDAGFSPRKLQPSPKVTEGEDNDEDFEDIHEATPDSEATNGVYTTDEHIPTGEEEDDEELEHLESSRIVTAEEISRRFSSPLARRRRQNKSNQSRVKFIVAALFGLMVALIIANTFVFPLINDHKKAIKPAE